MTIGDYLIQRLAAHGVGHVFGIPGDYVLSFYYLLDESPINVVGCTREDCAGFAADALNSRGLNEATDSVTIRFSLLTVPFPGRTFADVLVALSLPGNDPNNWLRIGLHVTSIGGNDGNSDSYVNNTEQNRVTVIPLPPAAFAGLLLLLLVIAALAAWRGGLFAAKA